MAISSRHGLVSYSSAKVERIKGKKTTQIPKLLGMIDYNAVVHRDNMAMQE